MRDNTLNMSRRVSKIICLITFALIAVECGEAGKKCADFNEYCLNHWDCCSNSCASYLYRCTRNYNIYPYTFFGSVNNEPAKTTIDDILELNFGQETDATVATTRTPLDGKQHYEQAEKVTVRVAADTTTQTETQTLKTTTQPSAVHKHTTPKTAVNRNSIASTDSIETDQKLSTVKTQATEQFEMTTLSNNNNSVTASSEDIANRLPLAKCKEIGDKCYDNSECCSQRCPSYFHHCVT